MHLWSCHPVLRPVLGVVGLLVAFMVILYAKVTYNASQDFALAEETYTRGEYKVAITHYERTIKWYAPLSTVVQRAVARLWRIGTEAEASGELTLALEAYQTLRSSLYAVQSFYIPYQSSIPKSEERIALLLAKTRAGAELEEDKLAQDTARFAIQLQRHVGPHLGWSVLVEVGFLGWVGAAIGLIWYVMDEQGHFAPRQGMLWGSFLAVFFVLWVVSMRFA